MKGMENHEGKIRKIEEIALSLFATFTVLGGVIFGYITSEIKNYSGIENLKRFQPSMPTRLYDVNGELIAELFQEKRELITFDEMPVSLINSFLAAEDRAFYDHFGLNPMAIVRAMGKNVIASLMNFKPTVVQGGSTITQQLAKRLFTTGERTVMRKALEAVLAFQIEKKFSKEEILEMYFNQIYLGHGCHGISTAAKFYFDKDVRFLNVVESSVLAALPSKPFGFSPLKYPKRAYLKNRDTLNRMVDAGFMTEKRSNELYRDFWPAYIDSIIDEYPTKTAISKNVDNAPYFTDYVRQILLARFGKDAVYNEGLSVYTTLNLKRQSIAQKLVKDGVEEQDKVSSKANEYYNMAVDRGLIGAYGTLRMIFPLSGVLVKNDIETMFKKEMVDEDLDSLDILTLLVDSPRCNKSLEIFRTLVSGISTSMKVQGAMIAIEPKTGYISTMIGGAEFEVSNQYNRAVQARRQPGSAFKPFVYGAAVENKRITTTTELPDAPIVDIDAQGDTWSPGNYEGDYSGMVPINRALASSINIISVRIYDLVGADRIIEYASKMLKVPESRFTPNPTLALGTTELTPFEMATAYAVYANRGRDVIPFAVRYVLDRDGNEMANIEGEVGGIIAAKQLDGSIQIISEDVAWIMTSLMQGVIDHGTASESIRGKCNFMKQAAGKTGTTTNWTDAWFCGFTSDLAAAVWIGYDRQFMSLGKHQAGAGVAAPIWARYMKEVYNGMPDPAFPPRPEGVQQIGAGWGLKGATAQYYNSMDQDNKRIKMESVLERYMEKEGLKVE
ncbi:MAG: PBP1A family penicillin-binding protein [Spirochaetes bacterium]|jgi:penicillin-binding protein 1A|nr:PBP1A family penicillin-binding protein [Spirochaetota bacterium]